jgi:hypothetical protein
VTEHDGRSGDIDLAQMIGKRLLVGITYLQPDGSVGESIELIGVVTAVDPLVAIDRGDGAEPFTLPPEPGAYQRAAPGEYRLHWTGETVVNPDFLATWTVEAPADDGDAEERTAT